MNTSQKPQHTPFIAHMRRWDSGRLFESERAVQELVESPGWQVLIGLLDSGKDSIEDRLKYSKPLDNATQYAQALGQVAGLESVQAAAEAVLILAREVQEKLESEIAPVGAEVA